MATQAILAEKAVSVTELRKNPLQYFSDEPVVVLSHNKAAGYMVSPELFEQLVRAAEALQAQQSFKASFRPSGARLHEIATSGNKLLQAATDEELEDFAE